MGINFDKQYVINFGGYTDAGSIYTHQHNKNKVVKVTIFTE